MPKLAPTQGKPAKSSEATTGAALVQSLLRQTVSSAKLPSALLQVEPRPSLSPIPSPSLLVLSLSLGLSLGPRLRPRLPEPAAAPTADHSPNARLQVELWTSLARGGLTVGEAMPVPMPPGAAAGAPLQAVRSEVDHAGHSRLLATTF